jgi:hypothetical protein
MKLDDIENVHPIRQITIASVVQILVFGLMLFAFWINDKAL